MPTGRQIALCTARGLHPMVPEAPLGIHGAHYPCLPLDTCVPQVTDYPVDDPLGSQA